MRKYTKQLLLLGGIAVAFLLGGITILVLMAAFDPSENMTAIDYVAMAGIILCFLSAIFVLFKILAPSMTVDLIKKQLNLLKKGSALYYHYDGSIGADGTINRILTNAKHYGYKDCSQEAALPFQNYVCFNRRHYWCFDATNLRIHAAVVPEKDITAFYNAADRFELTNTKRKFKGNYQAVISLCVVPDYTGSGESQAALENMSYLAGPLTRMLLDTANGRLYISKSLLGLGVSRTTRMVSRLIFGTRTALKKLPSEPENHNPSEIENLEKLLDSFDIFAMLKRKRLDEKEQAVCETLDMNGFKIESDEAEKDAATMFYKTEAGVILIDCDFDEKSGIYGLYDESFSYIYPKKRRIGKTARAVLRGKLSKALDAQGIPHVHVFTFYSKENGTVLERRATSEECAEAGYIMEEITE